MVAPKLKTTSCVTVVAFAGLALLAGVQAAEKKYGPGVTDTEIKLGNTTPYSGPASIYSSGSKAIQAYFEKVNEEGGVNGRKINFISYDDAYSPPKTVEQVRKLIDSDQVLALFNPVGTPTVSAVNKQTNAQKVPMLFVASGASKWADPEHYPWTIGWLPTYDTEGRIYADYILKTKPNAKIGILYQADDYGKDFLKAFKDGLGDQVKLIVSEVAYNVTDPTIDSQIVTLKTSGADTFFNITSAKFAAQAIRKAFEIQWKPLHLLVSPSASVAGVIIPAGPEKAVDVVSLLYFKDPTDPRWSSDEGFQNWRAWMLKYNPGGNIADILNVFGYSAAQTMVQVLKQCGDDLTRENVMKQAANLKDLELPMILPGIKLNTGPTDYRPIEQGQLIRFDGKSWVPIGELLGKPS